MLSYKYYIINAFGPANEGANEMVRPSNDSNVLKGLQLPLFLMLNGQMVNVFNIFYIDKTTQNSSSKKPQFFPKNTFEKCD